MCSVKQPDRSPLHSSQPHCPSALLTDGGVPKQTSPYIIYSIFKESFHDILFQHFNTNGHLENAVKNPFHDIMATKWGHHGLPITGRPFSWPGTRLKRIIFLKRSWTTASTLGVDTRPISPRKTTPEVVRTFLEPPKWGVAFLVEKPWEVYKLFGFGSEVQHSPLIGIF